jgi:transcriptional regulator with XRE-family HTH domain
MSEVARAVGVTSAYLSAIKRGIKVNPSYATVKKLSEVLNDSK